MNKRIKKKKAKQDLQREQERLAQELDQLTPDILEEVTRTINQVCQELGKAIAYCFDGLVEFFKILEVTFEEIEQQGASTTGPRTIQVQRNPTYDRFTQTRTYNQKSRQPRWIINRNQQTYRNRSYQARR